MVRITIQDALAIVPWRPRCSERRRMIIRAIMRTDPPIWSTGCPGLIWAGAVPDLDVRRACEAC